MTCEMCGATVPPGEQFDTGSSDYILCADREGCTDRMIETAKARTLGEAAGEPVTEEAAQ
jgi:hypothetical protein